MKIKEVDFIYELIDTSKIQLKSIRQIARSYKHVEIKFNDKQWEADFELVGKILDVWQGVHRKWKYLDSVFSNDKFQLNDEAKNFSMLSNQYFEIMKEV